MTQQTSVYPVGSPGWVAARNRGIGASEIGSAIGCNKWQSPFELWERKTGNAKPIEATWKMKVGTLLENQILDYWLDANDAIDLGRQLTYEVDNEACPIWATIDCLATTGCNDEFVLEAKHTSWRNNEIGETDTDQIPMSWICQAQCQMAATNTNECVFAVSVDANEPITFRVQRDHELWAKMLKAVNHFWRHVIDKVPPPKEHAFDDELARWWSYQRQSTGKQFAEEETANDWFRYKELGTEISGLQKTRDEIKARIMRSIPESSVILDAETEIYIREVNRKGYTVEPSTYYQLATRKRR